MNVSYHFWEGQFDHSDQAAESLGCVLQILPHALLQLWDEPHSAATSHAKTREKER